MHINQCLQLPIFDIGLHDACLVYTRIEENTCTYSLVGHHLSLCNVFSSSEKPCTTFTISC